MVFTQPLLSSSPDLSEDGRVVPVPLPLCSAGHTHGDHTQFPQAPGPEEIGPYPHAETEGDTDYVIVSGFHIVSPFHVFLKK